MSATRFVDLVDARHPRMDREAALGERLIERCRALCQRSAGPRDCLWSPALSGEKTPASSPPTILPSRFATPADWRPRPAPSAVSHATAPERSITVRCRHFCIGTNCDCSAILLMDVDGLMQFVAWGRFLRPTDKGSAPTARGGTTKTPNRCWFRYRWRRGPGSFPHPVRAGVHRRAVFHSDKAPRPADRQIRDLLPASRTASTTTKSSCHHRGPSCRAGDRAPARRAGTQAVNAELESRVRSRTSDSSRPTASWLLFLFGVPRSARAAACLERHFAHVLAEDYADKLDAAGASISSASCRPRCASTSSPWTCCDWPTSTARFPIMKKSTSAH